MTIDEIRFADSSQVARECGISWEKMFEILAAQWAKEDPKGAARAMAYQGGADSPPEAVACRFPDGAPGVKLEGGTGIPMPVQTARGLAVSLLMHSDIAESIYAVESYLAKGKDKELAAKLLKGISQHIVKVRNEGLAKWIEKVFPKPPDGTPMELQESGAAPAAYQ